VVGDQLHAVADAEDGNARAQGGGIDLGRAGLVDRGRAAGEDEALRVQALELGPGSCAGDELAVDARFADAAGDQLGGLAAVVEDQDGFSLRAQLGRDRVGYLGLDAGEFYCLGVAMKALTHLAGITGDDVRRLRARGIRNSNQLLQACTLEVDRETVSRRTGISPDRLLEFARQCALLEISSLERWLEVVRRLGVTDLKVLKKQDPVELQRQIADAVGMLGAPTPSTVEYWISQARSIDTIEEYEPPASIVSPSVMSERERDTQRVQR
jgi:hypothetical protein